MRASVGDRIVIASNSVDGPVRDGVVTELRHPDGEPPYQVAWSDGSTSMVFPGPDVRVVHDQPEPAPSGPPAVAHVRTWRVELHLFEEGGQTTAHAVLRTGETAPVQAEGEAHRRAGDVPVAEIGDEIAAARALRHLADLLLQNASSDLTEVERRPVSLPG